MSRLPPPELYAHKQFKHHLGYGLFAPDPGDSYDRVRVGDVGYVSHTGVFIRLFNAFHDADSPENQRADFPENFIPIAQQFRRLEVDRTLTKGHLVSESVNVVRFQADAGLTATAPGIQVEANMTLRLQCASRTGAVLLLNHAPTREWARSSDAMVDYILTNCMSWLHLVKSQRLPVELHDLVFVQECTMTGDWATVVWDESSFHSEINFKVGINGGPNVGVSYWGEWEDRVSAPKRQGPRRTADARQTYAMEQYDQCIFLKGIRVALREWYQKLAMMLVAKGAPDGAELVDYSSSPSVLRLLKKIGFKVENIGSGSSSFRPMRNASEMIAVFILENSDVDIAVVEESDINSFNLNETDSLESMCEVLLAREDIGVSTFTTQDSNSKTVGRICLRDFGTYTMSHLPALLDEAYNPLVEQGSRDWHIGSSEAASKYTKGNNGSKSLEICLESGQAYRPFSHSKRIKKSDAKKPSRNDVRAHVRGVPDRYLSVFAVGETSASVARPRYTMADSDTMQSSLSGSHSPTLPYDPALTIVPAVIYHSASSPSFPTDLVGDDDGGYEIQNYDALVFNEGQVDNNGLVPIRSDMNEPSYQPSIANSRDYIQSCFDRHSALSLLEFESYGSSSSVTAYEPADSIGDECWKGVAEAEKITQDMHSDGQDLADPCCMDTDTLK